MYRVLIIDDEKIIRIALKSIIDWESLGFTVSNMASDGTAALELLKKQHPHLIIVDIMMPQMDGITFIKRTRGIGYEGEFIILSNHQEFQYALEAIRNGVFDYIVKTDISPDSLIGILKRVKRTLDSTIKKSTLNLDPSIENPDLSVLKSIIEHKDHRTELIEFSTAYLFLDVFIRTHVKKGNEESLIPQNTLKNIAMEFIDSTCSIVTRSADQILILVPKTISLGFLSSLPEITDKISRLVNLYMNTDCGFVCSSMFHTVKQLQAKLEALPNIERLIFHYGFHSIIEEKFLEHYTVLPPNILLLQRKMKRELMNGNYQACKKFMEEAISNFRSHLIAPAHAVKAISKIYEFVILDNSIWLENARDELQLIAVKYQNSCTSLEYAQTFNEIIDLIAKNKLIVHNSAFRKEINTIDEFITTNIHKKITLSMLAENVNMSENYISRLFKAETGVNIIHYINLIKMEYAKEMLESPDTSVKEIAISLGFDDSSYFNKIFNKLYKCNPSEYRKILMGEVKE